MIKFIVLWDEDCDGVFDTRGDAEEYILSLAEEMVYEDFLAEIMFRGDKWVDEYHTVEDWFNQWKEDLNYVWIGLKRMPRQTTYSAMLDYFAEYLNIQECNYFPSKEE